VAILAKYHLGIEIDELTNSIVNTISGDHFYLHLIESSIIWLSSNTISSCSSAGGSAFVLAIQLVF